jgi:signal transduction histidine kinase/Tfp pilus assembly protein PilF
LAQEKRSREIEKQLAATSKEDTVKVRLLSDLSFCYHAINPDTAIILAKQALQLATRLKYAKGQASAYNYWSIASYIKGETNKAIYLNRQALALHKIIGDKHGEASALNNMAIIFHNEGKLDSALRYYQQSLAIANQIDDKLGIGNGLNNIGNLYTDKGDYSIALERIYEGLKIREELHDSFRIGNSYNNIAGVYYLLKKYEEAKLNAKKAYDIQILIGDKDGEAQSIIVMGLVFNELGLYDSAIVCFNKVLKIAQELDNINTEGVALTNLGEVANKLKDANKAIHYYEKAGAIFKIMDDLPGIAICEIGIGKALITKRQFEASILRLERGYTIAKEIENKLNIYEGAKYLAEAYEEKGDIKRSLSYLKTAVIYRDSLYDEENSKKVQQIEFNYLLAKKQNEITLLEKDKSIQEEKTKFQNFLSIGLLIVVIILSASIFIINRYRVKEKASKDLILLQKLEIETQTKNLTLLNNFKDKTFSILSHDLKNPISSLTQVVELMDEKLLTEEDFAKVSGTLRKKLKSLNILLDNTLNWGRGQMSGDATLQKEWVEIGKLVQQNIELFSQFLTDKSIQVVCHIPTELMVWVDPNHLDIAIRNIFYNAIKFTYPNGQIVIAALKKDKEVELSITDNGKGMSKEILETLFSYQKQQGVYGTNGERGAGIGLLLTKDYMDRNGAKLLVNSKENEGTSFTIVFQEKA